MRYVISVYTFDEAPRPNLVRGFADLGFDTMSFTHRTLLRCDGGESLDLWRQI